MSMALYDEISRSAKKTRADTEATDVDMAFSDGTTLRRRGDGAKTLEELDKIIALAEARAATYQA